MALLVIAALRRTVHMDRLFIVTFTPILVVILLRYGWQAWKYLQSRQ